MRERITKEILKLEILVISTCNFELDVVVIEPYIDRYMTKLYPDHYKRGSPFCNLVFAIVNDSYFTYANLVFSS